MDLLPEGLNKGIAIIGIVWCFVKCENKESRYEIQEVIGKGSYGVVASAVDTHTGKKVAIKKINNVLEHVSEATCILREFKLPRLLRHPDIVEIKHILLLPCPREFKDTYVVFELMECELQHVIKANGSLTPEQYQFFLYHLLQGLKYMHTGNVFHQDLKPKKILANAYCKLKLCDFGLARAAFGDTPMVHQVYKLVKWMKPQPLFYKLNSDGSCIEEGMCGAGGVIRDSNGHMILVFSVFQGPGTSNWAKEPATLYA